MIEMRFNDLQRIVKLFYTFRNHTRKKNINKQTNARTEYLAGKPTDPSTDILRLNVRGSDCSVFCSVLLSF